MTPARQHNWHQARKGIKRHWQLYLLLILPVAWLIVFKYAPMFGLQIAFKDYMMREGFFGSPWVGLKHFKSFMSSYYFPRLIGNTVGVSLYNLIAGFFPPILLAIALNECRMRFFKKSIQMITYAPYFLSTVVVVSILIQVLSLNGVVNTIITALGGSPISFISDPTLFKSLYVWSDIWQKTGYNSIMYIAALAAVNPEMLEAAEIDGANIWQRIWYVDIPSILPTAIIMFIVNTASALNVGFEKVYLMQNPLNMSASDVISTYTYRMGLVDMNYSLATAVNLFQSVISFVFMLTVNRIARKLSDISLW
ncbi:ABC transporter permease subunit [Ruminococcaceae bacterium OttesenSCG-928-L11]|nr:ABC transporter permease subunit [Ruminococcaceae bacterium OttesenSCG-928-L11]